MDLLLLTVDPHPESVLPSLSLLAHNVRAAPTEVSSLLEAGTADVAIVGAGIAAAAWSGLSIAFVFLLVGWKGGTYYVTALSVGVAAQHSFIGGQRVDPVRLAHGALRSDR